MPISRNILSSVRESLSRDVKRHPSVEKVLKQLPLFEAAGDDPVAIRKAWDSVSQDLAILSGDGNIDRHLLESFAEEVFTLAGIPKQEDYEALRGVAGDIMKGNESDVSAILIPGLAPQHRQAVNIAFTLRALALHPRRVLPPGKSLTSLFMKDPNEKTEEERKREQSITDVIKQAYWDAALEQVSSPEPEIHIPRIKTFYHDLSDAIRPFTNRGHPLMISLTSPLSPSPNPLASALNYLRATLAHMRTLCAPVRDHDIDAAITAIDDIDKLHAPRAELAKAYTSGMKFALDMSQIMVDDQHAIMAKYGDESNVKAMLRGTAREQEREVLVAAFGMEVLRKGWKDWSEPKSGPHGWTNKLLDIISNLEPVMMKPQISPPILQMHRMELAEAQSLLLGVIIAGSIRTLIPVLSVGRQTVLYHGNQDALDVEAQFMERLWELIGADPFNTVETFKESDLDNLTVEVSRLWKQRNTGVVDTSTKEKELAEMVRRMVSEEDHPVRVLLKKRVVEALKERLAQPMIPVDAHPNAPATVAAGRAIMQRIKLKSGKPFVWEEQEVDMTVLGFTDPQLKKHLRQIVHTLRLVEGWVEYVWEDII